MTRHFAWPLVAVLLAACAGGPWGNVTAGQQLLNACETYTDTLSALAFHRALGNLSEVQVDTVNQVRVIANPICEGRITNDLDGGALLAELERGLLRMLLIQREVERDGDV